ncbi:hypothetical protein D1007_26488 [Hordeum vulgare]|nr:hypothetical protein D1007_26488 [Hordeum vulgare]
MERRTAGACSAAEERPRRRGGGTGEDEGRGRRGMRGSALGFLPNMQSALHSEVLAAEAGLRLASELGVQKVVLETDALLLKEALEEEGVNFSCVGAVFDRLRTFIRSQFLGYKIEHCTRICNQVAHALAANGTFMAGVPDSLSDRCDPCVSAVLASDCASHIV